MSKQLATRLDTIAIEDLNATGMTRSARGSLEQLGRHAPGELRRQLTYKTIGSAVVGPRRGAEGSCALRCGRVSAASPCCAG
ncbi:hypothetical protein [Streptomyces viridochromogenes]|uniref:hypothetical protein n=1 Tax=Streptomyces viridochromogenes TaxID=1938 RepID=UPI0034DD8C3D